MHIFLTGPLQSGKSTAIARYLAGRPESPGGFRTRWDRAAGRLALELLEELAREQQVLLFTCQCREGDALEGTSAITRLEL